MMCLQQASRGECLPPGAGRAEKWLLQDGLVPGEAHVALDAKDGVLGRQIAGGMATGEEGLDEVFKEQFGPFVLWAMGFKSFMVIVQAKVVQESEDGLELGHGKHWNFKL
jgi:hypothetical protein